MSAVIYMISDTGAIHSRDNMAGKHRERFIAMFRLQGYRVCTKDEYEAQRRRQQQQERRETDEDILALLAEAKGGA